MIKMKVVWFASALLAASAGALQLETEFGEGFGSSPFMAAQVGAFQNNMDAEQIKQAGKDAKMAVEMDWAKKLGATGNEARKTLKKALSNKKNPKLKKRIMQDIGLVLKRGVRNVSLVDPKDYG